jgi:virulence factor
MLPTLIQKYKALRRQRYLDRLSGYRHSYAFIGAGQHSTANLYPCIRQLNLPLKYICTKTPANAEKMASCFIGATGVTDIRIILEDPAVRGVFVCTQPALHAAFARQLLQAGKAVFIEKPPAFSLPELEELIGIQNDPAQNHQPCVVGLQRRFSTLHHLLKTRKLSRATYHYRYLTGPFPEGNPIYELFIHPIDYAIRLFGAASISAIQKAQSGPLLTWYVHLQHATGASGQVELSTAYSWSAISESLEINTEKEILTATYPFRLTGFEKPGRIAGIPLEKLAPGPTRQNIYLDNTGALPLATANSLVSQGFFGAIDHFVRAVEQGIQSPDSNLSSLRNTYEILDQLSNAGAR